MGNRAADAPTTAGRVSGAVPCREEASSSRLGAACLHCRSVCYACMTLQLYEIHNHVASRMLVVQVDGRPCAWSAIEHVRRLLYWDTKTAATVTHTTATVTYIDTSSDQGKPA